MTGENFSHSLFDIVEVSFRLSSNFLRLWSNNSCRQRETFVCFFVWFPLLTCYPARGMDKKAGVEFVEDHKTEQVTV